MPTWSIRFGVDIRSDSFGFPRKFLAGKVESSSIETLANIVVIGPGINIRISAQDPMTT
jgi:hypothetical protein